MNSNKIYNLVRKGILILRNNCKKIFKIPAGRLDKIREERVRPWFAIEGDKTLRLEYTLNKNSIVFDLGGYEGQWSNDIFSKYQCEIYIFEPVKEFFNKINNRFCNNKSIHTYNFGLSNITSKAIISKSEDGSSIFRQDGKESEEITLINFLDFVKENNISHIDLMKINIEGAEYNLLEYLVETNFIKNIYNIQVQFHDFIPNAENRMNAIQERLKKTHRVTFQYPFVWENWERIKSD